MTDAKGAASVPVGGAWMRPGVAKNLGLLIAVAAAWLALDTGYLAPDRPTRADWERLERAHRAAAGDIVYEADFSRDAPGSRRNDGPAWAFYNRATTASVQYDAAGVTLRYRGIPWIGPALNFSPFEPGRIYRVIIERAVEGEPAAVIVRNRQLDLVRAQLPLGRGNTTIEFLSPRGRLDRVVMAFIPDNPGKPVGSLRIERLRIERLKE